MIARIQGTVIEASPLRCVLDINGIGYEIHIPVTTAEKIPPLGQSATLFIHAVYREDSATLYGFASVIIENGGSGSAVAAPIAHKVLNFAYQENV